MKNFAHFQQLSLFIILLLACSSATNHASENDSKAVVSERFKSYWMSGQAELSSYHLKQARYGELHEGSAVLIYVTEDFSKSKQVKLDDPGRNASDAEKVLKLNFTKKFNTGLYPYSMMQSVFSPLAVPQQHALKVATSSQEWCGQTFTQLNALNGGYDVQLRSYFESEGDQNYTLNEQLLEDEIWNWIRLNPSALPLGKQKMVRGTFSARLRHLPLRAEEVEIELTKADGEVSYQLLYPKDKRTLIIRFEEAFPHRILGWKETYVSGWGKSAQQLTTTATLNKRMKIDYWTRNKVSDAYLRDSLGLK
jgi:hypothetical protein